jgi:hypothetical protein
MDKKSGEEPVKNRATRVVVAGMGVICGLIGIQHGLFEILQGNIPTGGIMIDAIGPELELWEGARETALTLIPNFLVTGICATLVSLLVIVWSVGFVHRKYGALILFALSVVGLLVGWGITPFEISILASLAATRINRPLTWWRKVLPAGLRRILAQIWLIVLITFALLFIVTISITVLGLSFLDTESTIRLLYTLGLSTLGLMILAVVAGFAEDIERQVVAH